MHTLPPFGISQNRSWQLPYHFSLPSSYSCPRIGTVPENKEVVSPNVQSMYVMLVKVL